MNHRIVIQIIGKLMQLAGIFLLLPTIAGVLFGEKEFFVLASTAAAAIVIGGVLRLVKADKQRIRAREGFIITAVTWLLFSLIGAIPFFASGAIPSYTDAVFETASGFTTTGASILLNIEAMPKCLLLWRSFTHWIGGMGILVFMLAFVPSNVDEMNIDMLSASGHKINGPKGIGVMYIRKGVKILSFIHGGAQERQRRAGTHNVPITTFSLAVEFPVGNILSIQIELDSSALGVNVGGVTLFITKLSIIHL